MPWQDVCPPLRLFVRMSVTRWYSVETAKYSIKDFIGYPDHSSFLHQTGWQYSYGDPLKGRRKQGGGGGEKITLYLGNDA